MSELRSAIEQYLTVRRALGYKLVLAERLLRLFCTHCETIGALESPPSLRSAGRHGCKPGMAGTAAQCDPWLRRLAADDRPRHRGPAG